MVKQIRPFGWREAKGNKGNRYQVLDDLRLHTKRLGRREKLDF